MRRVKCVPYKIGTIELILLVFSCRKLPSTYDAESLADKRRVEDLLTKNIGEEEREPQIADLDMDFADEEEIL